MAMFTEVAWSKDAAAAVPEKLVRNTRIRDRDSNFIFFILFTFTSQTCRDVMLHVCYGNKKKSMLGEPN